MSYKSREQLLAENKCFRLILQRLKSLIDSETLYADTPDSDEELFQIGKAKSDASI